MTVAIERTVRRFKPYSGYKDSGVEWLGLIPSAWEVKPLKHLTTFATGWTPPTGRADLYGGEHLWANIGDLGPRLLTRTEKTITDAAIQEAGLRVVKAGSLLFSFKLSVGAVSIAGVDMYTNEAIAAFAPSKLIDTRYLYWAAPVLVPQNAQENIYGAPLLSRERIANALLLHPPQADQRAIADFLDRETTKIDDLIAKKERLIELLHKKRTALITRAVTRGLDPNVPMKDSGVEWLGEIPAHWEVQALGRMTECLDGRRVPLNAEERGRMRGEYPYWGANGIVDYIDRWSFDEELVLLGEDGAPFFDRSRPVAFCVSGKFWVNNHAHVLRPRGMVPSFLAHSLNCVDYHLFIDGTTRDKLTQGNMKRIPLQRPPVSEQRAIAEFLDRETGKLDGLVAKVREGMERLKEFRSALITAAVTGKIDVR